MGFPEYLTALRLRYAAGLLTETDESVTQICFSCGFGNLSHFLRCFKKEYGSSPQVFRREARIPLEKFGKKV